MSGDGTILSAPTSRPRLVGRTREYDDLRAHLDAAMAGRGQHVLLAGEPGIGKTRLADELASEAAARGAKVAWGRCWEDGGAPAYWPWIEVLRACARDGPAEALAALHQQGSPHVAALVGQLQLPGSAVATSVSPPPALGAEPAADRFHLFDAVTRFLAAIAASTPLVVILDDAHAADVASLRLLQFVARTVRHHPVLLLVTYREADVRRSPWLTEAFADLAREGRTVWLRGLGEPDVREWLGQGGAPTLDARAATVIHRITDGNPFFVNEIVGLMAAGQRHLPAAPEGVAACLDTFGIPDGIRVAIRRRVALASADARRVLAVGAVAGREFDAGLLRDAIGLPAAGLTAALEDAVACGLVAHVADAPERYRFTHVLVAETLSRDLVPERRQALHLAVARAIEAARHGGLDGHLAELAHHYARALPLGPVSKAVEFARRGAQHAESVLAYEEAARLYDSAVTALESDAHGDLALSCDLLLGLGENAFGAGRFERTREAFARAADAARRLGSPERLSRAALGFGLPPIAPYTVDPQLVALLEGALTALDDADSALRTQLLARLASELHWSPDRARGAALSQQAVAMARRLGDPATLVYALFMRHLAAWSLDNLDERLAIATEIISLAERAGPMPWAMRAWELRARYYRFVDLLELGDVPEVDAEIARYRALAAALRQHHGFEELALATRALMDGRLGDAERFAERALDAARRLERREKPFRQAVSSLRLILRREQGRLAEILPLFRAPRVVLRSWVARCSLAYCLAALGHRADAAVEWEALAAGGFADVPRDAGWMAAMVLLSEVCAMLDDAPRARQLYERLAPYADRNATLDVHVCYGAVAHYLGRLAATFGEERLAEAHFAAALQRNVAMGATLWATRSRYEYARLLLRHDRAEDRARAASLCELARASATALALPALSAEIAALAAHPAVPDGTLTIMFTDLQDSTGMTDRLGDRPAQALLREHNAVVREQIVAHRGREVKTTGDGFMIAFDSARRAIGCAIAIQRALADRNACRPTDPLRVSIGLHSGEAVWEAGDYYGKAVIVAARLAALAGGGEILASATVRDLTGNTGAVAFGRARTVSLKGFAARWRVHAVDWQHDVPVGVDAPFAARVAS